MSRSGRGHRPARQLTRVLSVSLLLSQVTRRIANLNREPQSLRKHDGTTGQRGRHHTLLQVPQSGDGTSVRQLGAQ
ncbi:hypothetical protein NDU88_000628 [Pleurodeles waltl]|uniref:Secreted protein n=1 Tax=Pleurodeles waltl TaxID=8319 RepID=A0AAV7VXY2_PLEWA|nr:hypothetical protein NDU88_000628 [Pleurodeles waltl]